MVKTQIEEQNVALAKSSEAASKASASSTETPSPSSDPLDDLEEDDTKSSSSSSAAEPLATEVAIIYTEDDLKSTEDAAKEATKWLEEKQAAQNKLKEHEDPVLTVKAIKAETEKLNQVLMNVMMKKMAHFNYSGSGKGKAKPKPKPSSSSNKKKASKKDKKGSKKADSKDNKGPTQEELDAALEKAGLKKDGIKLQAGNKDVRDKDGKLLTQLELGEDATEEEILEAIRKATGEGNEKVRDEL